MHYNVSLGVTLKHNDWIVFKTKFPMSTGQAIRIGLIWLVMTIIFEFLLGHYIVGHSWERLIQDYNILKGRVWILGFIWILIAPYIIYQLQKESHF